MPHIAQIIAECDCPTPENCTHLNRCLAEKEPSSTPRWLLRHQVGMAVAEAYAELATCPRRKVGVMIADVKGRPLSVGYNGTAAGRPHCIDNPCPGAKFSSGQGLDKCEAIHAEQNAILYLRDPDRAHTIFLTTFPCNSCIKLLLGTSIQEIVYRDGYPHSEAASWWKEAGRRTYQVPVSGKLRK